MLALTCKHPKPALHGESNTPLFFSNDHRVIQSGDLLSTQIKRNQVENVEYAHIYKERDLDMCVLLKNLTKIDGEEHVLGIMSTIFFNKQR